MARLALVAAAVRVFASWCGDSRTDVCVCFPLPAVKHNTAWTDAQGVGLVWCSCAAVYSVPPGTRMPMEGCSSNNQPACKQASLDATLGAPRHLMLQHVFWSASCPLCVCHMSGLVCMCVCVLCVYRRTHCPTALRTQRRFVYLLARPPGCTSSRPAHCSLSQHALLVLTPCNRRGREAEPWPPELPAAAAPTRAVWSLASLFCRPTSGAHVYTSCVSVLVVAPVYPPCVTPAVRASLLLCGPAAVQCVWCSFLGWNGWA